MDTRPRRKLGPFLLGHSTKHQPNAHMSFLKNPLVVGVVAFLAGVVAEKKFGLTQYLAKIPFVGTWLA